MVDIATLHRKLETFSKLCDTLPATLPYNAAHPPFGLDSEEIPDLGHSGALNHCLHREWGYKAHGLSINERGSKLNNTICIIRNTIPVANDLGVVESWLDAFIVAAHKSGASEGSQAHIQPALNSVPSAVDLPPKKKFFGLFQTAQSVLRFRVLTKEEAAEQKSREMEALKGDCARLQALEKKRAQDKEQEKKDYERERKAKYRWKIKRSQKGLQSARQSDAIEIDTDSDESVHAQGEASEQINVVNEDSRQFEPVDGSNNTAEVEVDEVGQGVNHIDLDGDKTLAVGAPQPSTLAKQDKPATLKQQNARLSIKTQTVARREAKAKKTGTTEPPLRTNWQIHWTWIDILEAQQKVGWSPTEICKYLYIKNPKWYKPSKSDPGGLHKGTVGKWIKDDGKGGKQWTQEVLDRADRGRVGVTRRSKILAPYPEIVKAITTQLEALRTIGSCIQRPLASAVIRSHINHSAPYLFSDSFKMSETWVHNFLVDNLGWSMRKATRASRKVPPNADDLCRAMHARVTYTCRVDDIHPDCRVNPDQAGLGLFPTGKYTYEKKGSQDVSVAGHEEKRQTTVVCASSMSGNFLPFQSIWGGTTDQSLPSKQAARRNEADELGFTYGHGDKRHWSSRDTTKQWILNTFDPYIARMRKKNNLPDHAKSLLLLDVWPVHIAKKSADDFLPWMKRTHPNVVVLFIPGGCTGIVQPADVGLQRLMKHHVKRSATDFLVARATRQLAQGVPAEEIKLPTDLPTLRNASVAWLLDAYRYFDKNPDIVRKAWANSKVGDLNLSCESVSSSAAWDHCQHRIKTNPEFRAEFASLDFSTVSGPLDDTDDPFTPSGDFDDEITSSMEEIADHCFGNTVPCSDVTSQDPLADADFEVVTPADFQPGPHISMPRNDAAHPVASTSALVQSPVSSQSVSSSQSTQPAPSQAMAPHQFLLAPEPSMPSGSQSSSSLFLAPLVQSVAAVPSSSQSVAAASSRSLALPHQAVQPSTPNLMQSDLTASVTSVSQCPSTTFRLDIAVQGGTNHGAFQTVEETRVTDKKKKATADKAKKRKRGGDGSEGDDNDVPVPKPKRGRPKKIVLG